MNTAYTRAVDRMDAAVRKATTERSAASVMTVEMPEEITDDAIDALVDLLIAFATNNRTN